ncbi:MAG: hypothetical protein ACJATP_003341 [Candidatus Azotimanducaceae bacterium]|jgi:hypothetical protein
MTDPDIIQKFLDHLAAQPPPTKTMTASFYYGGERHLPDLKVA